MPTDPNTELTVDHHRTETAMLPSAQVPGDPINLHLYGAEIPGWVRAVIHTNGKVRYSIRVQVNPAEPDQTTTLHNVDSVFITPRTGDRQETEFDNYS